MFLSLSFIDLELKFRVHEKHTQTFYSYLAHRAIFLLWASQPKRWKIRKREKKSRISSFLAQMFRSVYGLGQDRHNNHWWCYTQFEIHLRKKKENILSNTCIGGLVFIVKETNYWSFHIIRLLEDISHTIFHFTYEDVNLMHDY